ncbi:MAG: nucleotidyltransferase [Candidatus Pacearchaeota archaeon]|nr:nucleotidyltransferase [Candidatus Pacearchaeota archaeon]
MISNFKQIEELFNELDKVMKNKIDIYTIGGAVLLYQGLKSATKDIDLVVNDKKELIEIENALMKIGFVKNKVGDDYKNLNTHYLLVRGEFKVDMFVKKVCSKFSLSEHMIKRAKKVLNLDKLSIFLCSNEDVFLFKTMTEREGDLEDCMSLNKPGLDWDSIYNELLYQIKENGEDVWVTWIGERLDLLVEKGIEILIMGKIDQLREDFFNKFEKEKPKK